MGISIHLAISKSVTKEEWEKVYEETLQLIKNFPLAEKRTIKIHGVDTFCLVPTEEHEETYGWHDEKVRIGWDAVGDYTYMRNAEDYYLPRDLVGEAQVEADAGDAMFSILPVYMNYDREDERFNHVYDKWGAKTQGEPYHMYLLAVAALIEARLGTKAFVYGDITRGQLKKAVETANQYLDSPIEMPDRCYEDRLLERVKKFPLPENEQLAVWERFYLGTKDAGFGDFMRREFSNDAIETYWKKTFNNRTIGTVRFDGHFNNYMLWGFELGKLCEYICFTDEEENPKYEEFVERVMDAKLHLKDKNCEDALEINQEQEQPYGIYTLFAKFALAGARNKKVDRYIPIEDIREALVSAIGDACNVNKIIDAYLEEEAEQEEINLKDREISNEEFNEAVDQDVAEVFNQIMEKKCQELQENDEKYDITDYADLKFYEDGDTMPDNMLSSIAESRKFIDSLLEKEEYKNLMEMDAHSRCEWLSMANRYFLIRDTDWDKVYTDIERNPDSFGRYYPLFRVKLDSEELIDMSIAFMINDAFYAYSGILAENMAGEKK